MIGIDRQIMMKVFPLIFGILVFGDYLTVQVPQEF